MLLENEQNRLRQHWAVEPPAPDLADRIIYSALARPQQRPLMARLKHSFAWPQQHSYAMGGFAVAACLTLAVIAYDGSKPSAGDGYEPPMDQLVEDLMWSANEPAI